MSQSLDAYIREVWAPEVQENSQKRLIAREICREIEMPDGDTYHKPYGSRLSTGDYTRNSTSSAVSATDVTTTDEYLSVDTAKYASFYIDRLDKKQMFYNLENDYKEEAIYQLADVVDAAIFAEYSNFANDLDAGDLEGSDGTPITVSTGTSTGNTGNILDVLEAFKVKMAQKDVRNDGDWFIVMDEVKFHKVLEKYMATNGFMVQDKTLVNGYKGRVLDVDIYVSRNLSTSTSSSVTTRHWVGGKKKRISLAMQQDTKIEVKDLPQNDDATVRLGTQYIFWMLYGKKTFTKDADQLVDIQVNNA